MGKEQARSGPDTVGREQKQPAINCVRPEGCDHDRHALKPVVFQAPGTRPRGVFSRSPGVLLVPDTSGPWDGQKTPVVDGLL